MTNTQTAKLMALRTLLNMSDFFTPAAKRSIIKRVMTNARKSGARPGSKHDDKLVFRREFLAGE